MKALKSKCLIAHRHKSGTGLAHDWLGQQPYPSLSIKGHTVSGYMLLSNVSNHINSYDGMALSQL